MTGGGRQINLPGSVRQGLGLGNIANIELDRKKVRSKLWSMFNHLYKGDLETDENRGTISSKRIGCRTGLSNHQVYLLTSSLTSLKLFLFECSDNRKVYKEPLRANSLVSFTI